MSRKRGRVEEESEDFIDAMIKGSLEKQRGLMDQLMNLVMELAPDNEVLKKCANLFQTVDSPLPMMYFFYCMIYYHQGVTAFISESMGPIRFNAFFSELDRQMSKFDNGEFEQAMEQRISHDSKRGTYEDSHDAFTKEAECLEDVRAAKLPLLVYSISAFYQSNCIAYS